MTRAERDGETAPLLVIAAGGTGGHMFPAQALAEEMLGRGWRVSLATDARGLRYAAGFPDGVARRALSAAAPGRGGRLARLAAPARILWGAGQAARWFARDRPAVVAGFGGYPSLPALAGAVLHRIPRLIHEQNGVLGRVNRRFAAHVGAVACGVHPVANAPAGAALVDMGNPIRQSARDAMGAPYRPPGADGEVSLLVFGGSQGASAFAALLPAAIAELPEGIRARLRVTQQARPREISGLSGAYRSVGIEAEVADFFADMPRRIAGAQLVICRAGASTVAELTAIGRPAILVPFPAAMDDHQTANAKPLADAGAAILAPERGLTGAALAGHIRAVLDDPARAAEMAAKARALGRSGAGSGLADLVGRLAQRKD